MRELRKESPVHASSAFRCATIQSVLPSKWSVEIDDHSDANDIRAVTGLVADIYA